MIALARPTSLAVVALLLSLVACAGAPHRRAVRPVDGAVPPGGVATYRSDDAPPDSKFLGLCEVTVDPALHPEPLREAYARAIERAIPLRANAVILVERTTLEWEGKSPSLGKRPVALERFRFELCLVKSAQRRTA